MSARRVDWTLLLFLALSVFAWLPLASPGYVAGAHDARHSVMYLIEFDQNIRDGVLWPRWSPDHAKGFGYPFWIFYGPLGYYVAEGVHLLGFGYTDSIKIVFILAFLVGGVAMYALAARWWGRGAGLVAALAYTYAPYRLVDVYVRNVFAESFAFALLPLALLAFWHLAARPGWRRAALAAVAYALVILSHSAIMFLFSLLLGLYLLFLLWRHRRRFVRTALWLALALALALALTAIQWLPMLAEAGNIVQEQWAHDNYLYDRQFVYLHQFLSPLWGFGFAVAGPDDGMAFQLGAVVLVLALCAAVAAWQRWVRQRALVAFLAAVTALVVFAITPLAGVLWHLVPQVGYTLQFPWRALTLTTLTLALLAGAAVAAREDETEPAFSPAVAVAALLVVLASFPYTQPPLMPITARHDSVLTIVDFEHQYPDQLGSTVWGVPPTEDSSLIPQYEAGVTLNKGMILAGTGTVEAVHHGGASDILRVRAATPVRLLVQTYWYPGWRAWVDGQPVDIEREGPHALIALDVPAGEHVVTLRFTETPLRLAATLVSLATLAGMVVILLVRWRVRRSAQNHADG